MVCMESGCSPLVRKDGFQKMGQEKLDIAQEVGLQQHLETSLHGIMKLEWKLLKVVQ